MNDMVYVHKCKSAMTIADHERHGLRAQVQKCNDNCTVGYLFASEAHVTPHGHHHYLPPGTFPPEFHPTNTTIPLRHTTHTPSTSSACSCTTNRPTL